MKDVKLIVCDIDGTLVDSNSKISNETIKAINEIISKDIKFALATGRNNNMVRPLIKLLNNNIYSVTNNGALVEDYKNDYVVYKNTLTKKQSETILNEVLNKGWEFICYSRNNMYYSYYDELIDEKLEQITFNVLKLSEIKDFSHKLVKSVDDIEDIDSLLKIGVREFNDVDMKEVKRISDSVGAELKNSGERFNAIFPKNISKEIGLMKLQEYLNIDIEHTVAIGDYDNDLPLFKRAKYKVAVANASDRLKAEANEFTSSNDDDGVCNYLMNVIKK